MQLAHMQASCTGCTVLPGGCMNSVGCRSHTRCLCNSAAHTEQCWAHRSPASGAQSPPPPNSHLRHSREVQHMITLQGSWQLRMAEREREKERDREREGERERERERERVEKGCCLTCCGPLAWMGGIGHSQALSDFVCELFQLGRNVF